MWFYIYNKNIKAARVHSPSLKSSYNAPKGCSSLQAEIYLMFEDKSCSSRTPYVIQYVKSNCTRQVRPLFMLVNLRD